VMPDSNFVVIHGQERKLDWLPDKPDQRDYKYSDPRFGVFSAAPTPDVVNLSSRESPIRDQGRLGSCTGFSLAGQAEFVWSIHPPGYQYVFSPQFVYWNEREEENTINQDSGAFIRDGIKVLASEGVCFEKTWPYKDTMAEMVKKPSDQAFQEALKYKVG